MKALDLASPDWLDQAAEGLRFEGCAVVHGVLSASTLDTVRPALHRAHEAILRGVGPERLARAGEKGVLRLMFEHDPVFFRLLETPAMLAAVDRVLADTAILHLQNGFILPAAEAAEDGQVFQHRFHRDFPRVLNGYLASLNAMFAVDAFTADNGATLVVPGTHQRAEAPSLAYMEANAIPIECPPGSMVLFDSTLWHAAGLNRSPLPRLGINHQFTRSYIKQQIDYVRALGDAAVLAQAPRTQQLLGWYTRVVTSLDEYYRPEAERLYRKGQG